jgi:uncharacterized protein
LLSGARQIGKTTLLLQAADTLLRAGVPSANVLYATFDHPILKLAGIDAVIDAWREREPRADGLEYLLLDAAPFIRHHWQDVDPLTRPPPPAPASRSSPR